MKVWTVEGHIYYEENFVLGIYSTEEKAKEAKRKGLDDSDYKHLDEITISEWEVDGKCVG